MDQLTITFKNCPPSLKSHMEICFVTVPKDHMEVEPLELRNDLVLDFDEIPEDIMRAKIRMAIFDFLTVYGYTEIKKRDNAG
jgi:hypothetical protein